ncbi:UDP-N-acetylglucosamine--N-acetylmuramyl-(pentapeptide) pyrophosphoryl-undecaprenol N-acetylglucosamine transferase [Bienertia sinuspersici]
MALQSWIKPPSGIIKINTDAHIHEGIKVGLGVVCRDNEGRIQVIATKVIEPTNVEVGKAEATRYGLQLARRLGFESIILEGDATNVVNAIKSHQFGFAPVSVIYFNMA